MTNQQARGAMAGAKATARRLENEHRAALATRWAEVWDELAPEYEAIILGLLAQTNDTGFVTSNVLRASRLEQALEHTREQLVDLVAGDVQDAAVFTLPVAQAMVDGDLTAIRAQLPPAAHGAVVSWDRFDPGMLDAMVERTTQEITARSMPLPDSVVAVMRAELTRGVSVGDNPRAVARRMVNRTGELFTGGRNRALNIARTEMLDAAREAQRIAEQANTDVLAGWQWGASLDSRCCPACVAMHGSFHPTIEPGPLSHPSCRCARIPVTKGWGELGIPGLSGGAEMVIDSDEGETWLSSLDGESQRRALGPARFEMYQKGEIGLQDLVAVKRNDGWHDSIRVPSVVELKAQVARR